jgi:hypothetical protein
LCLAFLLIFPPFLSPPFRLFPTSHVFGFQTVLLIVLRKVAYVWTDKSVRHRMDASVFTLRVLRPCGCVCCDGNQGEKADRSRFFLVWNCPRLGDAWCTRPSRAPINFYPTLHVPHPWSNCVLPWHTNVSNSLHNVSIKRYKKKR